MKNYFCKYQLHEVTMDLVKCAQGMVPAELLINNCKLINVCTKEIQEGINVAVIKGRIAYVGTSNQIKADENTVVIDANGKYLAPGFMDGHMHIESSMLTVNEYAKAVIPHGTSACMIDPHEICNVLGMDGVKYMIEESKGTPLKTMVTAPSCVPAVPGFEDTGSHIGPEEIKEMMTWNEIVGLGEMMNFPGILYSNEETHKIVGETLKADKCVTGHYSVPETDTGLNAYIASGVRCCHESTREIDSLTKMRLGMYAQLREGSAWHDLCEVGKAITNHEIDSRFACLVTDDTHPHTLTEKGHLDYVIKRAIEEGIDPISAIQMVTINVAALYQLDHEMGSITPSKCADMVLIDDINTCHISMSIIDGEVVSENGVIAKEIKPYQYPESAKNSVHLNKITEKDLRIEAEGDKVKVRAMEVIPGKTITLESFVELPVINGEVVADSNVDTMKAVVFERHHETGRNGYGFIKGFGIKKGALAQTVAHDAHNLLVVGTNDKDMVIAANTLIECGGGLVAVLDGKVIGLVPLRIAGLMSDNPLEVVNKEVEGIEKAWIELGSKLPSPFMTMGIQSLACIPEIRLTNRGLVDCRTFEFVDLIIKE